MLAKTRRDLPSFKEMLDPRSDAEQLKDELSEDPSIYRYGEYRQRRWYEMSAGWKVILVASCVLWLVMLAVTSRIIGDVHDLGAVAAAVLFFIEMPVAIWVCRASWGHIGAGPRTVLRFFARTWFVSIPILLLMIAKIAAPFLMARELERRVAAGATVEQSQLGIAGAVEGNNWRMVVGGKTGYQTMSLSEARAACEAFGPEWELPTANDLQTFEPRPHAPERLGFWLGEVFDGAPQFSLTRKELPGEHDVSLKVGSVQQGAVLCMRDRAPPSGTEAAATSLAGFTTLLKTELRCSHDARAASSSL